jgi:AAA15 family ATPase/GTPase
MFTASPILVRCNLGTKAFMLLGLGVTQHQSLTFTMSVFAWLVQKQTMMRSLKIENFRCFRNFELRNLGRLNLLVGTNNSGKTSILEAVQLLISQASPGSLQEVMISRGEYIHDEHRSERELDIRHLFCDHKIDLGSKFSIIESDRLGQKGIAVSISHPSQLNLFEDLRESVLTIERLGQNEDSINLPLSPKEGLPLDYVRRVRKDFGIPEVKIEFITSSSLTTKKMSELFDQVVLTPDEDLVTEALRTIEPSINRIASVTSERFGYSKARNGFVVKLDHSDQRIPIGSMGDGIWRMLGLTLAIVNSKNGVLLVDEIDTGLHFSVMSDMWKLIWETAKRLNVQVFATTHSSDCWTSLAGIAKRDTSNEEEITIHRIERDKSRSVVFTEQQVIIAAERGIEVR